jgi:hypothetical protein
MKLKTTIMRDFSNKEQESAIKSIFFFQVLL